VKIWHQYPYIRLIFPLIAGILLAIKFDSTVQGLFPATLIILLVYAILVLFFSKRVGYQYRWITGVLLNLALLLSGYQYTILCAPKHNSNNISHYISKHDKFIIQVTEQVTEKPNSYKVIARAISYKDSLEFAKTDGKLILYFQKDSLVKDIDFGDQLIISANLSEVSPPMNPAEFNYKRYLSNKGIYNQGYIRTGEWQIIATNKGNIAKTLGLKLRSVFMEILQKQNIKGKEFAVVSAILLGYDDFLDNEQLKEFAGAGAMHILCVSGLHVGIIYFILNSLLLFLNKRRSTRILKVVILLLLIWLYALITGFSPSVLRASTMFSFVIAGGLIKRKVNIYNSLASSAFLLMIINPFIITAVGFQLSYLAVFGIVWLYRPVYNIFIPRNWMLRKIWQISVVSLAATLATFPLSLYYFHQFPNLFLVTNLIAIPASTLIIYSGILVLLTSPIPIVSSLFSFLLVKVIWFLNYSVKLIEGLSFSTFRGVYIDLNEAILIYCLIISISFLFLYRKKIYSFFTLGLLVLLLFSFFYRSYQNTNQKKIVVYNVRNSTVIDFMDGKNGTLFTDSVLINDDNKLNYHVVNNRIKSGIGRFENILNLENDLLNDHLYKNGDFIQYYDKRLIIINSEFELYPSDTKITVDYLLITNNSKIEISDLVNSFKFSEFIIDNSSSYWNANRWIEECEKAGVKYYLFFKHFGSKGNRNIKGGH